ncbi:MAG: FG-GAP repeat protein, partial [Planctomycetes bacterium]|nr:FG-GAP repeat protein [Planctomycetota bacterium]
MKWSPLWRSSAALGVLIGAVSTVTAQVALLELADGPRNDEVLELTVAAAGDVDGDGIPDAAIGRPSDEQGFGSVVLISGRTGGELWRRRGTLFEDSLGTHLDAGADLNGDGIGEVVALQAMRMPPRGYALSVF